MAIRRLKRPRDPIQLGKLIGDIGLVQVLINEVMIRFALFARLIGHDPSRWVDHILTRSRTPIRRGPAPAAAETSARRRYPRCPTGTLARSDPGTDDRTHTSKSRDRGPGQHFFETAPD